MHIDGGLQLKKTRTRHKVNFGIVGVYIYIVSHESSEILSYMGKQWKQCQTLFFWAPKSLQMVTAAMKLKDAYALEGKL